MQAIIDGCVILMLVAIFWPFFILKGMTEEDRK